jgi:bacterioferritin-associated ferredoxin
VIICVCRGITDRRVRQEAAAGHSVEEVFARTGAGSSCAICQLAVARLVTEEHARQAQAAAGATRTAA